MTLGQKGVVGENESRDAFNGVADLVIAKTGDIFIADGESTNTRVVHYSKDGKFVTWWGGKGTEPGKFDEPHSIAIDSKGASTSATAATSGSRFRSARPVHHQWTNLGTPWACSSKATPLRRRRHRSNCLYIASIKDGSVLERVDGLKNPPRSPSTRTARSISPRSTEPT